MDPCRRIAINMERDAHARRWQFAASAAAAAMLVWLAWHAIASVSTLHRLQQSHTEAASLHDSMLRLEAEVQRTAQLAVATGDGDWLTRHAEAEGRLRDTVRDLLASELPQRASLDEALAALDELSRIESRTMALLAAGRHDEAFELVTGPTYDAWLATLRDTISQVDGGYHDWLLSQSVGLTRSEIVQLLGALCLFAGAIAAWLILVRRLQREKSALLREMDARGRAEADLLRAQKLELLGDFSSSIAHDVENVLSAVAGYSSLARRSIATAARTEALDGLDRAVRQGRGLTRNLLSFVRHEKSDRKAVEIGALVTETQSWLAPLLPSNVRLQVRNEADGELWMDADPVQLQQALANLAVNARDAMTDGGSLTVSVKRCPGEVLNAEPAADCTICLTVTDTGCGMDSATLRRAREPFFSTKTADRGTGLGLVSVERIVEAHGGRLELESEPGAGTQARMLFPAVQCVDRPAVHGGKQPAVVVVSSDPYARQVLADALEDAGMAVSVLDGATKNWLREFGNVAGAQVAVIDWRAAPADAAAMLRVLRGTGAALPVILLMDADTTAHEAGLEIAESDLALVVSRGVQLGELSQLARRLAARHSAEQRA